MEAPAKPGSESAKPSEGLVAPKLTRDEAIAIATKQFTIPAELGQPNVGIQQTAHSAIWTLEWQSSSKQAEQTRISVAVNAVNGQIQSYSNWTGKPAQSLQLSLTRAEAKAKAQAWFDQLVPADQKGSLRLVDSPLNAGYWGGTSYHFEWQRDVNGYGIAGNGVSIAVNAQSGEVQSYSLNWNPASDYTLPSKILSKEEAEAAYRKQVSFLLQYQQFHKRGTDESEWRLVYRPLTGDFPRMNQEGLLLGWDGEPLDPAAQVKPVLVPASDKAYTKPAKPLEQEEALAVAQAITGRADAPTTGVYGEQGEEVKRSSWHFAWVTEGSEERPRSEVSVRIDAETGLPVEYYAWVETKPFEAGETPPVSLEQAQAKAQEFIRTYRPDLAGSVQILQQPEQSGKAMPGYQPTEYYIQFQLLKNGIPMVNRQFHVSVDARTGDLRNFWSDWYNEKPNETFPDPAKVISAEKAVDLFLQQQGIEPVWSTFWGRNTGSESKPVLAWQPGSKLPTAAIDAMAGVLLDYEGRDLIEAQRYPTDIKGHYAEREIELLWARGALEMQDGKFNPDAAVTAEDLAKWIILARGYRPFIAYDFAKAEGLGGGIARQAATSANSAYFGAALQNGIILPEELATLKELKGSVPRELFALWAVRAMGYGRVAKMEAQIEMSFTDKEQIGAPYRNAAALLNGLGIASGDGSGRFNPQAALTRADAAKILFAVSSEGRY